MARRKLPGGIWEDLGPGPMYPDGKPYPPPPRVPVMVVSAGGRPRGLTAEMRTRARRLAGSQRAPQGRRVALTVLELGSVSTAAEALGIASHQVYEVLRRRR